VVLRRRALSLRRSSTARASHSGSTRISPRAGIQDTRRSSARSPDSSGTVGSAGPASKPVGSSHDPRRRRPPVWNATLRWRVRDRPTLPSRPPCLTIDGSRASTRRRRLLDAPGLSASPLPGNHRGVGAWSAVDEPWSRRTSSVRRVRQRRSPAARVMPNFPPASRRGPRGRPVTGESGGSASFRVSWRYAQRGRTSLSTQMKNRSACRAGPRNDSARRRKSLYWERTGRAVRRRRHHTLPSSAPHPDNGRSSSRGRDFLLPSADRGRRWVGAVSTGSRSPTSHAWGRSTQRHSRSGGGSPRNDLSCPSILPPDRSTRTCT